ncbi:hypothetical protein GN956_G24470 [Arapaima gigas]
MALVTVQRSPTPSATSSPCVSEADSGEDDHRSQHRSISESFLTVKGAALFLPCGNGSSPSPRATPRRSKHADDLQQHLQTMFTLLRPEDTIRLAVRLESSHPRNTRYMVVVSTIGRQDTEESVVLGVDFVSSDCSCSVGLVLPLWSDTRIHLDGDGGFSVCTVNRVHVFKPVSVQAMWSALQSLHKACDVARIQNYYPSSLFLTWVSYYQSQVCSDQACINEWNAMQDVQSHRADSPVLFSDVPTERECTERLIKARLREIMMQKDLENVTSKEIRTELEMLMVCNLREFKEFIDNEMIIILGQMDSPTEIFEHVYLGSEWNASNLEELQNSGVRFILNVTREIDNFFPGLFEYHNIRVYDEEATDLLAYWNDTYKFISKAKKAGAKCLVHCKMGVSRSASTVIAYAMKEYGWDLARAFDHVKERRAQRHNKLWRSHSDSNLSEHRETPCKTPHTLGRSDPHNDTCNGPPSLQSFLDTVDAMTTVGNLLTANGLAESTENLPPSPPPEDHSAVPLPRPRAAAVVPEERPDHAVISVIETVPLRHPHPPPSLHVQPTPSQPPNTETGQEDLETLPSSTDLCDSLFPVHESQPSICSAQNGHFHRLQTQVPNSAECLQASTSDTPDQPSGTAAPASEAPISPLGTDSIDFFSAREKFVDLSGGRRPRSFSERSSQQAPLLKFSLPELRPLLLEDLWDSAAVPEDRSEVSLLQRGDGRQVGDAASQRPLQGMSELQASQHEEATPTPSPRRCHEEGQEEIATVLPPSPPLSDSPSPPSSPRTAPPASACCTARQLDSATVEAGSLRAEGPEGAADRGKDSGRVALTSDPSVTLHQPTSRTDSRVAASSTSAAAPHVDALCLEGVTETECEVDDPVCNAAALEDAWETLRELRTYLCETDGELQQRRGQPWTQGDDGTAEVGAHLDHLASPSLMKRSASLAKLGCLEFSSGDLSAWDLNPAPPRQLEPQLLDAETHPGPDDVSKKPCVLSQSCSSSSPSPPGITPDSCVSEPLRTTALSGPPSPLCQHRTGDTQGVAPPVSTVPRQQYGKTHPLRRLRKHPEKKRTSSFLYNTIEAQRPQGGSEIVIVTRMSVTAAQSTQKTRQAMVLRET